MDELQIRTLGMMDAGEAAVRQLSALTVTYAFSVLGAVILIVGGYIVAGLIERSIYAALGRFRGFDETLRRFFSRTARYALLVLVGVTVLAQFGVQTASIIAALGAVGLAIGLALQGTLQNIAAGIMLLALRPFRVGEFIEAGGVSGTVREIGLFSTELESGDGLFMVAPNSQLWNTAVTNHTRNSRRANNLSMRIGYGEDVGLALSIMDGIVSGDARVFAEPKPNCYVSQLDENGIEITIRYWAPNSVWWQARLDFTRAIRQALDENGFAPPYPQQQVRHLPAPEEAAK